MYRTFPIIDCFFPLLRQLKEDCVETCWDELDSENEHWGEGAEGSKGAEDSKGAEHNKGAEHSKGAEGSDCSKSDQVSEDEVISDSMGDDMIYPEDCGMDDEWKIKNIGHGEKTLGEEYSDSISTFSDSSESEASDQQETTSNQQEKTIKNTVKRGCDSAAVAQVKTIMKQSTHKAKSKFLSWAKTVGSEGGYVMSQGRRAPSNLRRDPAESNSKKKKATPVKKR